MRLNKLAAFVSTLLVSNYVYADDAQINDVIVVTATQGEQTLLNAPASVSVIDFEEIIKIPATDITTSLQDVVGVNVRRSGNGEASVSLRGLDPSYTLLLVNGKRVNSREALIRGSFDLSSIPMTAIERVEIVRGPMSAIYGSEAIGGVINVILKEANNEWQTNGNIDYSMPIDGGGELARVGVFSSGALIDDRVLATFGVNWSDRNPWQPDDSDYGITSKTEKQQRAGVNTSVLWHVTSQDTLSANLEYLEEDKSYNLWQAPDGAYVANFYESERVNFGVNYAREWQWGNSEFNYYFEQTDIQEDNARLALTTGTQTNHNVDGRAVFGSENHLITAGFDVSDNTLSHPRDYAKETSNTQFAAYIQDEWALSDEMTATFSGRVTDHSEFGSHFSPRAYLVYNANSDLTFKGGVGTGFKAPAMWRSSADFATISCGGRCVLVGNPDLEPEKSVSYELSASYQTDFGFVRATVFNNEIEDMIARDTSTFVGVTPDNQPMIQHININEVTTKGIEFDVLWQVLDTLDLSFNYSYIDSENKSDNLPLIKTPKHQANTKLNWQVIESLSTYVNLNYIGEQYIEMAPTWQKTPADGYVMVDLGSRFTLSQTIAFRVGITNLFDKRIDQDAFDYGYAEVGRSVFAGVDFSF